MNHELVSCITPEQAADLVRQISLVEGTFVKKKKAIINGLSNHTATYEELETINYAISLVSNVSNRAQRHIRKKEIAERAAQDQKQAASEESHPKQANVPLYNTGCFYLQQITSKHTGTEVHCEAEMDLTFCSTSCPYATNAPMNKTPVMTRTYGRRCG